MSESSETLVRSALDDIAILIGGAAALHHLDDDLVWTLMKRLDLIRIRLMRDLKDEGNAFADPIPANVPRVHPAVEEFVHRNFHHDGEASTC